ncbi:hypothetical protein EDD21DRAFT_375546 [Dissophora ornata]|nr:hypothetical protein EDD21DRAFT_375546 [Dissophora ornata]
MHDLSSRFSSSTISNVPLSFSLSLIALTLMLRLLRFCMQLLLLLSLLLLVALLLFTTHRGSASDRRC